MLTKLGTFFKPKNTSKTTEPDTKCLLTNQVAKATDKHAKNYQNKEVKNRFHFFSFVLINPKLHTKNNQKLCKKHQKPTKNCISVKTSKIKTNKRLY